MLQAGHRARKESVDNGADCRRYDTPRKDAITATATRKSKRDNKVVADFGVEGQNESAECRVLPAPVAHDEVVHLKEMQSSVTAVRPAYTLAATKMKLHTLRYRLPRGVHTYFERLADGRAAAMRGRHP